MYYNRRKEDLCMAISLRLNKDEDALFKKYAELNQMSVSEMIRKAVLERIEDEFDLKAYEEAMEEYRKNPVTHSLDEVEKELGLT